VGAKSLIRLPLERRFPGLGLQQQKKVTSINYFVGLMRQQADQAWNALGGARSLGSLGIVEPGEVDTLVRAQPDGVAPIAAGSIWNIMNVESWLRGQAAA
jgi:hypothetical protein